MAMRARAAVQRMIDMPPARGVPARYDLVQARATTWMWSWFDRRGQRAQRLRWRADASAPGWRGCRRRWRRSRPGGGCWWCRGRRWAKACSSAWAQGGMAAALGADDGPELHAADTDRGGRRSGRSQDGGRTAGPRRPRRMRCARLAALGAPFDRDAKTAASSRAWRPPTAAPASPASAATGLAGARSCSAVIAAVRAGVRASITVWKAPIARAACYRTRRAGCAARVVERDGQAGAR